MTEYWENWFKKTKNKQCYPQQAKECIDVLNEVLGNDCLNIGSVLDVGCGDYRFRDLFKGLEYVGIDLEYGFDITQTPWNMGEFNQKYDLVFTSLVLLLLTPDKLDDVIREMFVHSNKYVFVFEEIAPEDEGKYKHDYEKYYPKLLIAKGISKVNSRWGWFLWKKTCEKN